MLGTCLELKFTINRSLLKKDSGQEKFVTMIEQAGFKHSCTVLLSELGKDANSN